MNKPTPFPQLSRVHPAIVNCTSLSSAGRAVPQQQAACAHPGCDKTLTITVNDHRLKGVRAFKALAQQRKWAFVKDQFFCPEHNPKAKTEDAMATETKSPSEMPPREMNRDQRRAIFREIDDNYDNNGYIDGASDKTIAEKLKFPRAWVEQVRDENFGPPGADPKLKALADQVERLERVAKTVEEMGLRAAEQAEKLKTDVAAAKANLTALLQAVQ